jgi:hypothetical protein
MKHFKITPDLRVENTKTESLVNTLHLFISPLKRWFDKVDPSFFSYEIILDKEQTAFYFTISDYLEDQLKKGVENCWDKCALEEESSDPLEPFKNSIETLALTMKEHPMFSLKVDKRINIVNSIVDTIMLLKGQDKAFVQILAIPQHPEWAQTISDAYKKMRQNGEYPTKGFNWEEFKKDMPYHIAKGYMKVLGGTLSLFGLKSSAFEWKDERALYYIQNDVSKATAQKPKGLGFSVNIRIGVHSEDKNRRQVLLNSLVSSFNELEQDNYLVPQQLKDQKLIFERREQFKALDDLANAKELSMMVQLPNKIYIEKYNIPHIGHLEVKIPSEFFKGGLEYASASFRGKEEIVYFPTNNEDELCLPLVAVGGMGSGKTTGLGANTVTEFVRNGFGALAIDPAKGEIGDEVEQVLPADKVIRFKFGEIPYSLSWEECKHGKNPKDLLTNCLLFFFSDSTEDLLRTKRYIRSFVKMMKGYSLVELQELMEDPDLLRERMEEYCNFEYDRKKREWDITIKSDVSKTTKRVLPTLIEYWKKLKAGAHHSLVAPILNRLDEVLGTDYMYECAISKNKIDMVEIMSQKKAFIFDVPKSELHITGIETIVKLLMSKIDLAMTLRSEENRFPFAVVIDEPHQYVKSSEFWERATVEARKWRIAYRFLLHSFAQLKKESRHLVSIIKSASGHYVIYPTDKENWKEFEQEIKPYTIEEDALKLKRFHAINILRIGGSVKVFIAKMLPPPSMRLPRVKQGSNLKVSEQQVKELVLNIKGKE